MKQYQFTFQDYNTLFIFDMNGLKAINDNFGHELRKNIILLMIAAGIKKTGYVSCMP